MASKPCVKSFYVKLGKNANNYKKIVLVGTENQTIQNLREQIMNAHQNELNTRNWELYATDELDGGKQLEYIGWIAVPVFQRTKVCLSLHTLTCRINVPPRSETV